MRGLFCCGSLHVSFLSSDSSNELSLVNGDDDVSAKNKRNTISDVIITSPVQTLDDADSKAQEVQVEARIAKEDETEEQTTEEEQPEHVDQATSSEASEAKLETEPEKPEQKVCEVVESFEEKLDQEAQCTENSETTVVEEAIAAVSQETVEAIPGDSEKHPTATHRLQVEKTLATSDEIQEDSPVEAGEDDTPPELPSSLPPALPSSPPPPVPQESSEPEAAAEPVVNPDVSMEQSSDDVTGSTTEENKDEEKQDEAVDRAEEEEAAEVAPESDERSEELPGVQSSSTEPETLQDEALSASDSQKDEETKFTTVSCATHTSVSISLP